MTVICLTGRRRANAAGLRTDSLILYKALSALAIASMLPLFAAPARAQWVLTSSTVSATASETYVGPFGESETATWDVTDWDDFTYGSDNAAEASFGPWYGVNGRSGLASFKCTQTFVFDWVGGGDPPEKAYFLVTGAYADSNAGASMGDQNPYGPDFPSGLIAGELGGMHLDDPDDGFGDKPVTVTTLDTDPMAVYGPRYGGIDKTSSSPGHLVQKDGSSGEITITISGSGGASGTSSNQTYPNYEEYVYGCVTPLTVTPTAPPQAMITSSINTSYHKGAGGKQEPNSYSADGSSIQADSTLFYDETGGGFVAQPTFEAVSSFSNPDYSWTSTGSGSLGSSIGPHTALSVSVTSGASVSGTTSSLTLDATDTTGMYPDATATYAIKWHLALEKTDFLGETKGSSVFETRFSGAAPGAAVFVPRSSAGTIPFEVMLDGTSEIAALAGQEEVSGILKVIEAIAGLAEPLSKDYEEEHEYTGAINGADAWTAANAEEHGNDPDFVKHIPDNVNNWTDATMSLCRVQYYTISDWLADQYDSHGFNSAGHEIQTTVITSTYDEPVFTKIVY